MSEDTTSPATVETQQAVEEGTTPAPQQQEEPKNEEQVKSKPTPAPVVSTVDYEVVKEGFVQRQGHLWKKWNQQWMTLDEGGACLRWYKTNTRSGNDGTLYMSKCAEVCDPREGITTTWPEGVQERCFVVCSPNRAHYIIAESVEDKKEWVAKLLEAKAKFNTTGVQIISVDLFSVEAFKVNISAEMDRAQGETNKVLASEGTSTDQIGKDLDKAVKDVEKEVKKEEPVQQEAAAVVQQVETDVQLEVAETTTAATVEDTPTTEDTAKVEDTPPVVEDTPQVTVEDTPQVAGTEESSDVVNDDDAQDKEDPPTDAGKEE